MTRNTLPPEPPCWPIKQPGPPLRHGEGIGHRTSQKIEPADAVPEPNEPDAPRRKRV
jgi:hypothetical protein